MEPEQRSTLDKLISKIICDKNILNSQVKYINSDEKFGFMGNILKIQIVGSNKSLHLIVKFASTNDGFRDNLNIEQIFNREIDFYTAIIPQMNKFQQGYSKSSVTDNIAECYGTGSASKCEMLVLEDLIKSGYKLRDSKQPFDEQHTKLVLEKYAEFHSISIAYKYHSNEEYLKLVNTYPNIFSLSSENTVNTIVKSSCDNFKKYLKDDDMVYKSYCNFCDNLWKNYSIGAEVDEHAVIFHGDCWCNNFMFKYEANTGELNDVKIIDFQLTSPGSIAVDISYFLMVNASPEIASKLDDYLKYYYEQLVKHLVEMRCPAEEVYPFKLLEEQWKKYGIMGLIFCVTTLKFALAADDEKPDLEDNLNDAVNYEGVHNKAYVSRVKAVINYCYSKGILS